MRKLWVILCLLLAACGLRGPTATATQSRDLLALILARGVLIIGTDGDYYPQSEIVKDATRSTSTRCSPNEYTADEMRGFDVEVAKEIARRLGVEACFATPIWTQVISGNWGDRWDINVGSVTITPERMQILYFVQPYYSTPAAFFVHRDNTTFIEPDDLSGKRIGVCVGCTYEAYLKGALTIPGQTIEPVVDDAVIIGYDNELPALRDLARGDGLILDAVLSGTPTGQRLLNDGLAIKQLGDAVFYEYLSVALDKKSTPDPGSLILKLNGIIAEMHTDGTLIRLSQQYYDEDFSTPASQFDIEALDQFP
jgi:polar amino acid transport system substrate-binding protein